MTTALAAAQVADRVLLPKISVTRLSTTTSRTAPPPTALTTPSRSAEKGAMPRVAAFSVPVTAHGRRGWVRPAQPQYRLPEAGQRPAAFRCPAPPPLGQQQPGNEPDQFPGHIKGGEIGDHVKPSSGSRFLARPLLLGLRGWALLATAAFEPGLLSQAFLSGIQHALFFGCGRQHRRALMWSNTSSACPGRDGSGRTARRSAPDLLPQLSSARQQRFMWTYRQTYLPADLSAGFATGSAGTGVTRGYQDDGCEERAGAARSAAMACLVHRRLAR